VSASAGREGNLNRAATHHDAVEEEQESTIDFAAILPAKTLEKHEAHVGEKIFIRSSS
jgi:hypothetical protein